MKKYEVCFKYADSYSNWNWRTQRGEFWARDEYEAKSKCIKLYGLGVDCNYEIISVIAIS